MTAAPDPQAARRAHWIAEHPPAKVRAELRELKGQHGSDGAPMTLELAAKVAWLRAADAIDRL